MEKIIEFSFENGTATVRIAESSIYRCPSTGRVSILGVEAFTHCKDAFGNKYLERVRDEKTLAELFKAALYSVVFESKGNKS